MVFDIHQSVWALLSTTIAEKVMVFVVIPVPFRVLICCYSKISSGYVHVLCLDMMQVINQELCVSKAVMEKVLIVV